MAAPKTKFGRSAVHTPTPSTLFEVEFCNIRGLRSNLNAVHHHLETARPALFDSGPLARVYVCLYRSHTGDVETTRLFEHLSRAADDAQEQFPNAELVFLGDFNAHHNLWLSSSKTDHAGISAHAFALTHDLKQLVDQLTRIPDIPSQAPSLLDLLLTTHPQGYQVVVRAPLGSSDHCLISAKAPQVKPPRPAVVKRRIWHCGSADWDGMRDYFASVPWKQRCFSDRDLSGSAVAITEEIQKIREALLTCHLKGTNVALAWIPGHNGIPGNETADTCAKHAISSGLPKYSRVSYQHLHSVKRELLFKSWETHWLQTKNRVGKYYFDIQQNIPSKPWFSRITTDLWIRPTEEITLKKTAKCESDTRTDDSVQTYKVAVAAFDKRFFTIYRNKEGKTTHEFTPSFKENREKCTKIENARKATWWTNSVPVIHNYLSLIFIGLLTWGLLWCSLGDEWGWDGQWFRLAVVAIAAWASGQALQALTTLPPMLAALLTGILARNIGFLDMNQYTNVDSFLRKIYPVIILGKGSLGWDLQFMKNNWWRLATLGTLPWVAEVVVLAFSVHFYLGFPVIWGLLLGTVYASMSGAVVLPSVARISADADCTRNWVQLIGTTSGTDTALSVGVYGILHSYIFYETDVIYKYVKAGLGLFCGVALGIIMRHRVPEVTFIP
ncbi:hypothetical protein evm_012633 [Chilo suppressalis]|nr:hypothetical protein evm_012633 [Chilo suppressalis]